MKTIKYKCDVCGQESNGNSYGYRVEIIDEANNIKHFIFSNQSPDEFEQHACGQECLTKAFTKVM